MIHVDLKFKIARSIRFEFAFANLRTFIVRFVSMRGWLRILVECALGEKAPAAKSLFAGLKQIDRHVGQAFELAARVAEKILLKSQSFKYTFPFKHPRDDAGLLLQLPAGLA